MFNTLINTINKEIAREELMARTLKEKRTAIAISHDTMIRLTCNGTGDEKYYTVHELTDGECTRKYIGHKNQLIENIQQVHFIDKSLARIEPNLKALHKLLNVIQSPDALDVINALPLVYQDFDTSKLQTVDSKTQELYDDFLARKEANPHPYQENLRHRVTPKLAVRSKSEALIATELINRHVLFLYEAPLELNGEIIYPDFMIFHNGKIYIIEHLGLLADEKYFRKYFNRLLDLSDAGYNIGNQLFITCDDPNGNINMPLVNAIINVILAS